MVENVLAVPRARIGRFLDTVGDGSGVKNANTNGTTPAKTFTAATDDELTIAAHGLVTGDGPYHVSSTTTLPAPLDAADHYWVVKLTDGTLSLAISYANAIATVPVVVDITDTGTGTHTLHIPVVFKLAPPDGVAYRIFTLKITLEDSGGPAANGYAALAALARGIEVLHTRSILGGSELVHDFTDSVHILSHGDWVRQAGAGNITVLAWTAGEDGIYITWDLHADDTPVLLRGNLGDAFEIRFSEDLTGLVGHYFFVEGFEQGNIVT